MITHRPSTLQSASITHDMSCAVPKRFRDCRLISTNTVTAGCCDSQSEKALSVGIGVPTNRSPKRPGQLETPGNFFHLSPGSTSARGVPPMNLSCCPGGARDEHRKAEGDDGSINHGCDPCGCDSCFE